MRHARRELRHLASGVLCAQAGVWEIFVHACLGGLSDQQIKMLFTTYIRVDTGLDGEDGEPIIQFGHTGDFTKNRDYFVRILSNVSRFPRQTVGFCIIEQCYYDDGLLSSKTEML